MLSVCGTISCCNFVVATHLPFNNSAHCADKMHCIRQNMNYFLHYICQTGLLMIIKLVANFAVLVFWLLVARLSFNTDCVDIILCNTGSEVSVAALCWSCTVHCWHWISDTSWYASCSQCSATWFVEINFSYVYLISRHSVLRSFWLDDMKVIQFGNVLLEQCSAVYLFASILSWIKSGKWSSQTTAENM